MEKKVPVGEECYDPKRIEGCEWLKDVISLHPLFATRKGKEWDDGTEPTEVATCPAKAKEKDYRQLKKKRDGGDHRRFPSRA